MITTPTYYAVFFDGTRCIGHKRVPLVTFNNLTDGIEAKEVLIEGTVWLVGAVKVFNIINSIDNNVYAVVEVKQKI